jgi:ABC-2 type transport system permease protein
VSARAVGLGAGARTVLARETGAYFGSPIAYVYTVAAIVLANSLFMNEFFLAGRLDMTPFFDRLPALSIFLLPAISMRAWAEDRKQRTFELYVTLPLTPLALVLGKLGAALVLYLVFLAGTLPIVLMLVALGSPDLGAIACGYLGAGLLGALFLAFGTLVSSLSSDQIVAFVLAALLGFVLVVTGDERVVAVLDGLAPALAAGSRLRDFVSALPHYETFVRGVLDLGAAAYFLGLSALFLWLEVNVVRRVRS